MRAAPTCPRCGTDVHPPGAWSSAWSCELHGDVHPFFAPGRPSTDTVLDIAARSEVPVWLPWPLPGGWLVTGIAHAGDDRTGPKAVAVACTGPAPLGGLGELVLVAEEPGVGLGAGLGGLVGPDPGDAVAAGAADAKVLADGHPTPLWAVSGEPDRAVFVGEALGHWLWAVLWPVEAGYLVAERLQLIDLREPGIDLDLPFGAVSPRLVPRAGPA